MSQQPTDIFEQGILHRVRFKVDKGNLPMEDLQDLTLPQLNALAVGFYTQMQSQPMISFISDTPQRDPILELKLEIVKYFINKKKTEEQSAKERAQLEAQKAAKKQKLLRILDDTEDKELSQLGADELRRQLAEL